MQKQVQIGILRLILFICLLIFCFKKAKQAEPIRVKSIGNSPKDEIASHCRITSFDRNGNHKNTIFISYSVCKDYFDVAQSKDNQRWIKVKEKKSNLSINQIKKNPTNAKTSSNKQIFKKLKKN